MKIERNYEMIDNSRICLVYFKDSYLPPLQERKKELPKHRPKSGTGTAYNYAVRKKRIIINTAAE